MDKNYNDTLFKTLFLDEKNTSWVKEFLSKILKKEIETIRVIRKEVHKKDLKKKNYAMEYLVITENKKLNLFIEASFTLKIKEQNFTYFSILCKENLDCEGSEKKDIPITQVELKYDVDNSVNDYEIYSINNGKQGEEHKEYLKGFRIIVYNMNKIMKYYEDKNEEKMQEYEHIIALGLQNEDLKDYLEKEGQSK